MRKIAIVGAGQAGLLIAHALLRKGHQVTVHTDKTPDQLFNSRVWATPFLTSRACAFEEELGLSHWDGQQQFAAGAYLEVCPAPAQRALTVIGQIAKAGKSIDLRLKYARWLADLERRGGTVVHQPSGVTELESLSKENDLVLVTAGKGELSRLFPRDDSRSAHTQPSRNLVTAIFKGFKRSADQRFPSLRFVMTAGHGEFFSMPYFDRVRGPADVFLFEAIPGSGLDRFGDVTSAAGMTQRIREVVHHFAPWLDETLAHAEVVDETAWLTGAFTPTVRHPVARLPSGNPVMAVGDAVLLNDPIAGQGLNNATLMAKAVSDAILEHGDGPFTEDWMRRTFDAYWETEGQFRTHFTNMLLEPPPPHVMQLLGAASQVPTVAADFIRCFEDPKLFWPWITSPEQTLARIQRLSQPAQPGGV
ncbi:MAG TPA: styrene monooxygenase/indole monooxygenase family protein [Myxococcaceae bacterium]|nr:styrene monooxygenase/indole monooxygenase family protein [Myxococcaceae bacterium]